VDKNGVCTKTFVENLSPARFIQKASAPVFSDQCSLVRAPGNVRNRLAPLQDGQDVLNNLSAAIQKDGHQFPPAAVASALQLLNTLYNTEDQPGANQGVITPAGPICSWVIAHGIDGRGGLNDSAAESTKFLDALWRLKDAKGDLSVIRIGTYEYAIVQGGKVLHRNWHRDCGANGSAPTCSGDTDHCNAGDCQQEQCAPATQVTDLQSIPANAYYRLTSAWQGDGRALDVVNDGQNNKLQLAPTGSRTGQYWKLSRL
jgi:hypothetical protein